jgi:hypothetical protein
MGTTSATVPSAATAIASRAVGHVLGTTGQQVAVPIQHGDHRHEAGSETKNSASTSATIRVVAA